MKLERALTIIFTVNLLLLFPFFVKAQIKPLTLADKSQIIKLIFRQWKFKDSNAKKSEFEETVYFSSENISSLTLPKIKEIKFVVLSESQIEEMKKTGVKYYTFSKFVRKEKNIEVRFGIKYFETSSSGDSFTYYSCRKFSGKWKVKAVDTSASISESFQ